MSCPFLRHARPAHCRAVAEHPAAIGHEIVAAYCRARHVDCPAYRFVRASGRPVNPADFRAWVVQRISPGRVDPAPADGPSAADGG